jgi:hypothetical protein
MPNPAYSKRREHPPIWEGPRVAELWDVTGFDPARQSKVLLLLDAMDWPRLVVFLYDGSDRLVAPFVIGVSSEGNPLLRGYQLEGNSRSGKGEGWRVFQIDKIENLFDHQEYFYPDDFDFDQFYPWIYKVYKML